MRPCALERLLYLMAHPSISEESYCRRWECSRRTYYRDKTYVQDRLWMYEVRMRNEVHNI